VVEKRGDSPEISPRSGGVGASRQDKCNEKKTLVVTGVLLHGQVRSTRDSSCSNDSLTTCKAVFVVEKRVHSPEISPRSGGVGASRQDKRNGEMHSL